MFGIVKCIDIFIPDIPESTQLRIDIDEMIAAEVLGDDSGNTKVKQNPYIGLQAMRPCIRAKFGAAPQYILA